MRRLGAVGTFVWDRIENPFADTDGPREQLGGAVYSFASLSASCPPEWSIAPIVKIGADLWERGVTYLRSLPHVEAGDGVICVPQRNNHVLLRYHDLDRREEVQSGGVPGWRWSELAPRLEGVDALYINFLSGVELDLETTLRLRAEFSGPIYADLHSLFLGPPGRSARRPRPLRDWQRWLSCFDAIQLNEDELALLAPEIEDRERFEPELTRYGPRLAIITEGGRGVRYVAEENLPDDPIQWRSFSRVSGIQRGHLPTPEGRLPGDPTGCGDVWGAAFITGLLSGLELEEAIVRAEQFAATKIIYPDTTLLHERLADVAMARDF